MKKIFFFRFCPCIFESDTVKSDCPVQIFRKMMKYLKITLLVLLFSRDIKEKKSSEKKLKKSSENDQSTGHFQSFFIYFFRSPDPRSEKKSRKLTNKKSGLSSLQYSNTRNESIHVASKVRKKAKIRNRYNQVSHLTRN